LQRDVQFREFLPADPLADVIKDSFGSLDLLGIVQHQW
jgi:hypothetical protein